MKSQFDELCRALNLDSANPSEEALQNLRAWYSEHVSQDNISPDMDSVRDYLDVFVPNLPENCADTVPAFQQMNPVQYAASCGYDRYIDTCPASEEALYNKAFKNDMTPLHLAAIYGHVHAVKSLLQQGADPHTKNRMDQFPIQSALFTPRIVDEDFYKQKAIIFNLFKATAPDTMSSEDKSGETVAHKMAAGGYKDLIVDLIDENLPLIFAPDHLMKYPIHFAILNRKLDVVDILLKVPGVANLMDENGRLALHYAAKLNKSTVLSVCLPYYTDVDIRDSSNKTALLYAAGAGNLSSMIALIEHNADIHAKDSFGSTLLHHAITSKSKDIVTWILDNLSVDINEQDDAGHAALFYAKKKELTDITDVLVNHGAVDNTISPKA